MKSKAVICSLATALFISFLAMFHSCRKSILEKYIPYIEITGEPLVYDTHVKISAKIQNSGKHQIEAYGFKWNAGGSVSGAIRGIERYIESINHSREFEITIDYALKDKETYTIVAFVQTPKQTINSNPAVFTARGSLPPLIDSYHPNTGSKGDTVVIQGSRFPSVPHSGNPTFLLSSRVSFNNLYAMIIYADHHRIEAIVPDLDYFEPPFSISLQVPGHNVVVGDFIYTK